jgi:integrase
MSKTSLWSQTVSHADAGNGRVYERSIGGVLHISVWQPDRGEVRRSLHHRDKRRAIAQLREVLSARALSTRATLEPGPLTLASLFARYAIEGNHRVDGTRKTRSYTQHVTMVGEYLVRFFGPEKRIESFTAQDITSYNAWRRDGGASGKRIGTNTVLFDFRAFKAVCNWACQVNNDGHPLLATNPLSKIPAAGEKDPKRPLLTQAQIDGLIAVAPEVHPFLLPLIVLAWRSGHRLSSILSLRWDDLDLAAGTLRWRGEHDKVGQTWLVPAHDQVVSVLASHRKTSPGIGSVMMFPHPSKPDQPVTRHLAAYWLKEAFRRAKLEKPSGSLWHTFRRVWATERKHLPLKDVAAVGGWKDTSTLLRYQQPDMETMRTVVAYQRDTNTGRHTTIGLRS